MIFGNEHFEALEATKGLSPSASNLTRLGKAFGEELARWAIEQWDLRKRARAKFERADEMLFDRDGLEMASHEKLAEYHAGRFPPSERAGDVTCGIGADLIAIARRGPAIGFEIDPMRAEMAQHNLAVHGLDAEIRVEDCLGAEWELDFAFADPSRRSAGRRSRHPHAFEPNPVSLSRRMAEVQLGLMKLTPMLDDDFFDQLSLDREFVSFEGECREALVGFGKMRSAESGVRAIKLGVGCLSGNSVLPETLESPFEYFLEADPAAIRAHALGELCRRLRAGPLGDSNGYLTSSTLDTESKGWVKAYRTLAFGHADPKQMRMELRSLGARVEAVKVRGVKEDPIEWKRKLGGEGDRKVMAALYPVRKSLRYSILEPIGIS